MRFFHLSLLIAAMSQTSTVASQPLAVARSVQDPDNPNGNPPPAFDTPSIPPPIVGPPPVDDGAPPVEGPVNPPVFVPPPDDGVAPPLPPDPIAIV
ncbi:uncharacterized protein FIESC28_08614 [Fusarium coffeatum]|uniref:Uncharacterized protein n=1 Tax=Fusarium coffeatum TaxID=231269 RepID=A0A366R832_9HYPO|nr:uncharacterized protein FIESC28_08614 [Fusarium coffeatum]RBR12490.1 hypothetical protein FIESC28_08614 [Fusarium coffeatum]